MIFVVPSDCLIRINNLLIRSLLLESSAEVFLSALIIGVSEKKGNYCRGLNPSQKRDAKGGKYGFRSSTATNGVYCNRNSFCTSRSRDRSRTCESGIGLSDLTVALRASMANSKVLSIVPPSGLNDGRIRS